MQGKGASWCQSLEDKRNGEWIDFSCACRKFAKMSVSLNCFTENQNDSLEETKFS